MQNNSSDKKLWPTCYVVEELVLKNHPSIMVMEATLSIEIDQILEWYIENVSVEQMEGRSHTFVYGDWLFDEIVETVMADAKLCQSIYEQCIEAGI